MALGECLGKTSWFVSGADLPALTYLGPKVWQADLICMPYHGKLKANPALPVLDSLVLFAALDDIKVQLPTLLNPSHFDVLPISNGLRVSWA